MPNNDIPTADRPGPTTLQQGQSQGPTSSIRAAGPATGRRKRNHRGGKKKRPRKQSFAVASDDDGSGLLKTSQDRDQGAARESFYRLQGRNLSNTSIDSEALLDHREQQPLRPRRASTLQPSAFGRASYEGTGSFRPQYSNPFSPGEGTHSYHSKQGVSQQDISRNLDEDADERTPMLSGSRPKSSGYSGHRSSSNTKVNPLNRKDSSSSGGSKRKITIFDRAATVPYSAQPEPTYNVNYPPSVPGSPEMSAANRHMSFGDILTREDYSGGHDDSVHGDYGNDIGESAIDDQSLHGSSHPSGFERIERRPTIAARAEEDVCFPAEELSELGDDDDGTQRDASGRRAPRRRRGKWPELSVLDEWSRIEKEGRSEERRVKKMVEPQLIGGRLRPTTVRNWHRAEEDAPYRFTYFNEDFPSTIHSQTISELVRPGGSFRELFIPDPPQLSDSSSDEEEEDAFAPPETSHLRHSAMGANGESGGPTRQSSMGENLRPASTLLEGKSPTRVSTPSGDRKSNPTTGEEGDSQAPENDRHDKSKDTSTGHSEEFDPTEPKREKPKRYGDRPTWWLDVLSPTDAEMKILSKAFGIHPLTAEDIMMQEAREKVELFRNYYFVNYRTFEQDMSNEDFLEPVNMYVVVFREGVISFHFSLTPHPANVRRRIRQLKDYLILSSDWISYAIIDDITDVFAPLIQNIEDEVDDIDDAILMLHSPSEEEKNVLDEKRSDAGGNSAESGGDMLRRVGDCRKKVMGLYRLLGNKADVIKGFAKRCNEHWEVAPRSEIGLYLGDIQDHIVTMTGNLSHYEKILARSHGNYLAQINIRMNERQEQTADVLGKLTVLGTIVLPMNIITGLWGMNVWVPGQGHEESLTWFWCITGGLLFFGFVCFLLARTMYRLV